MNYINYTDVANHIDNCLEWKLRGDIQNLKKNCEDFPCCLGKPCKSDEQNSGDKQILYQYRQKSALKKIKYKFSFRGEIQS